MRSSVGVHGSVGRPDEGADGEPPLVGEVSGDGEAILAEEAVDSPLGHGLVIGLLVPRVVQRHLEGAAPLLLPISSHDPATLLRPLLNRLHRPSPPLFFFSFFFLWFYREWGGAAVEGMHWNSVGYNWKLPANCSTNFRWWVPTNGGWRGEASPWVVTVNRCPPSSATRPHRPGDGHLTVAGASRWNGAR